MTKLSHSIVFLTARLTGRGLLIVAVLLAIPAVASAQALASLAVGSPGRVGAPVAMTVEGDPSCSFSVNFGDSTSQDFSGLPRRLTHRYKDPGTFQVVVTATAPCTGTFTLPLEIATSEATPRLTGVKVSTAVVENVVTATVVVLGSGQCAYSIDFGDGTPEQRSELLPDLVRHKYTVAKSYTIVATAQAPCDGTARGGVEVRTKQP